MEFGWVGCLRFVAHNLTSGEKTCCKRSANLQEFKTYPSGFMGSHVESR
ncbi:hypothetical protein ATORI0001_0864 [Lancefieldella rimae ATCC 49626]|uniref:Uncharacterized protein n=1 Tax=Lancefieldella rimae (strain ATCC 49626 / DSM 7090 / CCUG 31168 / NBRC 15546 / VPI D140H-11A) TaxID=553184 RepID=B9CMQ4_LANR4|nr:hypothetical protein ATORI0001_0864 [Lancefieldella rimae ATCC 49626]